MATPKWAQDLTDSVCQEYGKPSVRLRWLRRKYGLLSHGTCYLDHINVYAGKTRKHQRLVLLHELAHWIRPRGDHHSIEFWKLAFQLYRDHGVPIRYAQKHEYNYMKRAKVGYARSLKSKKPA